MNEHTRLTANPSPNGIQPSTAAPHRTYNIIRSPIFMSTKHSITCQCIITHQSIKFNEDIFQSVSPRSGLVWSLRTCFTIIIICTAQEVKPSHSLTHKVILVSLSHQSSCVLAAIYFQFNTTKFSISDRILILIVLIYILSYS